MRHDLELSPWVTAAVFNLYFHCTTR